jgi:hypothetical protein
MSLADLQREPSEDPHELMLWQNAHRIEHQRIRQAIQDQTTVNLPDYVIDPITTNDLGNWLARHQSLHADMTSITHVQSVDLETVDFKDAKQRRAWSDLHYLEHFLVNTVLGI